VFDTPNRLLCKANKSYVSAQNYSDYSILCYDIAMKEIERKFLIDPKLDYLTMGKSFLITQAYLNSDPNRTVRVRIKGDGAFITIKGPSSEDGLERFEWETEIHLNEARELLSLCEPGIIEKTRVEIKNGDTLIEVDIFGGKLSGLYLAEIELKSLDQKFQPPDWFQSEVTGDPQYYNSQLIKKSV